MKNKKAWNKSLTKAFSKREMEDWGVIAFFEKIRKPWFELMEQLLITGALGYFHQAVPKNIPLRILYLISSVIFIFELLSLLKLLIIYPTFRRFLKTRVNATWILVFYGAVLLLLSYFLPDYLSSFFKLLGK